MRCIGLGVGAVGVLLCLRGVGLVHVGLSPVLVAVAVGAVAYGVLVGAGHARHERAWRDYRQVASTLPAVRAAWLRSLGTHLGRLAVPAGLAALVFFYLRGHR